MGAEFTLPEALKNLPGINLIPTKVEKIESISMNDLKHYENHPFSLYQDERKKDMVESIRENGILTPLIVRPKEKGYEILSGHNRFECGKEAGLTEFPCIIKMVEDKEAQLIVTITNLCQRSLADMPHSQKAKVIKTYYEAVKAQGKRNDLVSEIKTLLENTEKADEIKENSTSYPLDTKLHGKEKTSKEYNLSSATISRYLRIAELSMDFLELLDDGKLSIRAGVELSYLSDDEQNMVYRYITNNDLKIDMKKAETIRQLSRGQKLNEFSLPSVWNVQTKTNKKQKETIKLKRKVFSEYFMPEDTEEEIEETIKKALDFYFQNFCSTSQEDVEKTAEIEEV